MRQIIIQQSPSVAISENEGTPKNEVKMLTIGQKIFEETVRPIGITVRSVGPEGVETETTISAEIVGFGPAQGVNGKLLGTQRNKIGSNGIVRGTGQGKMVFEQGELVVCKLKYAGRMTASDGQKHVGTLTFMTVSEKLAWLNQTVGVVEGEFKGGPTGSGKNIIYEWS